MKTRLLLLAFLVGQTFLSAEAPCSASGKPDFLPPRPTPLPHFVGAGSCSASACHNANFAHGPTGSEFTTWATRDPHAKAYEALFEPRSVQIQKNLGSTVKAHEERRCLKCHVAPDFDEQVEKQVPYFRTDGVSCESCHGPAGNWLATHYAPSWRAKTPAEKRSLGMKDAQSIPGRAQLCATCHVGAPGMDVDHDLIAAGHPPLRFEFTAFHAAMPRHWPDAWDRDFEYRAWLTGQLVTAHAALELLAERAGAAKKPWPEFAEHDCAACHHDLSGRPQRAGKLGAVPWSSWNLALTPRALQAMRADADALADLRKEMNKGWANRTELALKARQAALRIKPLLERGEEPMSADAVLREILAQDSRKAAQSWDDAAQIALALAALQRHESDRKTQFPSSYRLAIQEFARALTFPGNYENPGSIDPLAVRKRLLEFKNKEGR